MSDIKYKAFWCEENIWHLAQDPRIESEDGLVVFITGAAGQVACWEQKAAEPGEAIVWDYHVTLLTRGQAWLMYDFDSRLGFPVAAATWFSETFPYPEFVPAAFHPRFALFEAKAFVGTFGSDRKHMQIRRGGWTQPPPPWPAISGTGLSLKVAIEKARHGLTLAEVRERLR